MSTTNTRLTVREIDVDVIYKDIKNLHITVRPPLGRVRVTAPRQLDDEQVRLAVIQHLAWIHKQRDRLEFADRQNGREMVNGESHYVWGVRRRLTIVERPGRAQVEIDGDRLILSTPAETPVDRRRARVDRWYRDQLRLVLPALIGKWEMRLDVAVPQWSIRRMKTRWGSCNPETGRLWFNVELAKKHPDCLELVVVHEMAHYFECNHGQRFTALMDRHLPDWRSRRDLLNGSPLAKRREE